MHIHTYLKNITDYAIAESLFSKVVGYLKPFFPNSTVHFGVSLYMSDCNEAAIVTCNTQYYVDWDDHYYINVYVDQLLTEGVHQEAICGLLQLLSEIEEIESCSHLLHETIPNDEDESLAVYEMIEQSLIR